jgi:hypothetical protein
MTDNSKTYTSSKEVFVILSYWPYEPVQVYGTFDTEQEAWAYAEAQAFTIGLGSFEVKPIRDINEEPEA